MKIWPFKTKKADQNVPLTPAVQSKIEKVFPHENWEQAAQLIRHNCGNSLPWMDSNDTEKYDRIRFAVIKLSKGKLETLEKMSRESHRDLRDVLVGAASDTLAKPIYTGTQKLKPECRIVRCS